jgi:hypothetical protein
MTTKTASVCSYPGTDIPLGCEDNYHEFAALLIQIESENACLRELNREQAARIKELESDLRFVFLKSAETLDVVATTLKSESILGEDDFKAFTDSAKEVVENGDTNRVLAHARLGVAKMGEVFHNWVTTSKVLYGALPEPPWQVAIPEIERRALQVKEHVEASGVESFSSLEAKQFLTGIEGQNLNKRKSIQALKRAHEMLPDFEFEKHKYASRLVRKKRLG